MKPVLVIFAKAPLMGKAKTRLAADIGRVHALRVYRAMCAQVLRQCTDLRWQTVLYITPDAKLGAGFGGLWPDHIDQIAQNDGGLSARLARIFNGKGPVIAIGTDCPQVARADIAQGFKALKSNAAVFGPARDGGFWLIGLNAPARLGVFDNIRWSHPQTLADMQSKIQGKIARLRTLTDVDDGAALAVVKAGKLSL